MTSIYPGPPQSYDRVATQRQLNDLAIDLSRHDVQLENMVRSGSTVGAGWGSWFEQASHQLLAGRDAYVALNPQDREIADRMGRELVDLSSNGGRIASAEDRNSALSHNWAAALDDTIRVVQDAASRLYSAGPTPNPQPFPPSGPGFPGSSGEVVRDATEAARLVRSSLNVIRSIPTFDRGSEETKQARMQAYQMNMDAQSRIERYFGNAQTPGYDFGNDQRVLSELRRADASLEDANWQLAKRPSPDGRFNGVDIPGAVRDTEQAALTLESLVRSLSTHDGSKAPA